MKMRPIQEPQLRIIEELCDFLQSRGWDVVNLELYRYAESDEGPSYVAQQEAWKEERWKWGVRISTSPQDQDEVLARYKERTL